MNYKLLWWELGGTIFIFLLGSFIHFGYEITNKINIFTAIFAVNESIWEHTKLTFWAPIFYGLIEYFFIGKFYPNFFVAKFTSAIITSISMIILYYAYTGITHTHSLTADLIIYEISIIIGLIISYSIIISNPLPTFFNTLALILLFLFIIIFYLFSYCPPKLPLFKCSVSGNYGIGK